MSRNFIFILLLPIQLLSKSNPDSLLTVDLQHKNLTKLPVGLNISHLQTLHIGNNPIVEIPRELIDAKFLKELSINNVNNFNIETSIPTLKKLNLQSLSLNDANLMYIPLELVQIKSLKHLSVTNNYIKEIPGYLLLNSDYQTLDLSNNLIKDLPKEIEFQEHLKTLSLNNNPCINDANTYNYLSRIQSLSNLSLKGLTSISTSLWNLKTLQKLDLSEGSYTSVNLSPDAHKNSLENLLVRDCNELDFTSLTHLLSSQNLKDVILGGDKNTGFNNISISPNLQYLAMSGKTLEHFSFSNTPSNLTELSLNFNTINCETELINTVTKCQGLKTLNISNCNVSRLPIQIRESKNLETLNISGNKLVSINELFNLKQLQTLDVSLCGLTSEQIARLKKELPNTTIINNDVYRKLPLENVLPKAESFNISTSITQKITTKEGTEITIPKNSFEYPNGKPVKDNVTLNFTPYYSLAEIAASGINMHYESQEISAPFSSAGMFNINATANGENLQLKKGAEIQVSFKSNDPNESYNYYTYDSIKRNWKEFGKDSITKLKIAKPEDTTKTAENITSSNQGFKYPLPAEFYKYQKIKLNWQLNHKNKTTGFFTISSIYEKPDIAFDTTKNINYFNEIKALSKYSWKVDAQKFSHEIWNLNNKNKIFSYTGETRIFRFLRPRYMSSTTIDNMDIEFDLIADKENDNFILKFYSATDTVCIHAYPNITGKNTDRIQKSTKKLFFSYDVVAKERKKVTSIRKNKFELAYKKYRENLSATRGMVSQLNSQNNNYIYARRVVADFPPVRRVISLMTLGFINCDRPIIIDKPVDISPIFVTAEGNEIKNGVYQVIDPKYNIVLSYYQPESIKVSKKTVLTFLYSSGTSNQVYIGKLNTFDISNRHGKVKVVLTPLNSQVSESQVAQSINSNN